VLKLTKGILSFPATSQSGAALADLVVEAVFHFGSVTDEDKRSLRMMSKMFHQQLPLEDMVISLKAARYTVEDYKPIMEQHGDLHLAKIQEFPTVTGTGETGIAAIAAAQDVLGSVIKIMRAEGKALPTPQGVSNA